MKNILTRNCNRCKHFRIDNDLGEYKCVTRCHYIHDVKGEAIVCDEYECEEDMVEEEENEDREVI